MKEEYFFCRFSYRRRVSSFVVLRLPCTPLRSVHASFAVVRLIAAAHLTNEANGANVTHCARRTIKHSARCGDDWPSLPHRFTPRPQPSRSPLHFTLSLQIIFHHRPLPPGASG